MKQLTAAALVALAAAACSVDSGSSEDLTTLQQEINTCTASGLEWKPFLARMAYDAAEDFGRWEFTTDLQLSGDRLAISSAGYSLCSSRGRSGCPAMTAALSAQEGNSELHNSSGQVVMNPNTIRSQLVAGFQAQVTNEQNQQWMSDPSEGSPYNNFQSASKTGLAHSVDLTNCAATIYQHSNFTGASQCLRTGSYRMTDLKIGDNQLSSIKVRSGMTVKLYEHDSFGGLSSQHTGDSALTSSFSDRTSSIVISQANVCSAIDSFKVTGGGADWHKVRGKLVTLGYLRGNDLLDVRLDSANNIVDVDPFNVDFIPPSQIGGAVYGVKVKATVAETWRSTEDPSPAIFPVGSACKKQPYGSTSWFSGSVRSSGSYRYCYIS